MRLAGHGLCSASVLRACGLDEVRVEVYLRCRGGSQVIVPSVLATAIVYLSTVTVAPVTSTIRGGAIGSRS